MTITSTHKRTKQGAQVSFAASAAFFVICVYPFNNAAPNALTLVLSAMLVLAGLIATLSNATLPNFAETRAYPASITIVALLSVSTLQIGMERLFPLVLLISAVSVAVSASRSRRFYVVVLLAFVVNFMALLIDYVTQSSVLQTFGVPLRIDYSQGFGGYRGRGLMGHPLLSGFLTLILGATLALKMLRGSGRLQISAIALIVVLTISISYFSGSRSVLLVGGAFSLIAWISALSSREVTGGSRVLHILMLAPALSVATYGVGGQLSQSRAVNFENLSADSSFIVRTEVWSNLEWALLLSGNGIVPTLIGRGFRATTDFFTGRELSSVVRTFDNQIATLYFDFGIIGLLALAVLTRHALRAGTTWAVSLTNFCAILMPAFFFDNLYAVGVAATTIALISAGSQSENLSK